MYKITSYVRGSKKAKYFKSLIKAIRVANKVSKATGVVVSIERVKPKKP